MYASPNRPTKLGSIHIGRGFANNALNTNPFLCWSMVSFTFSLYMEMILSRARMLFTSSGLLNLLLTRTYRTAMLPGIIASLPDENKYKAFASRANLPFFLNHCAATASPEMVQQGLVSMYVRISPPAFLVLFFFPPPPPKESSLKSLVEGARCPK